VSHERPETIETAKKKAAKPTKTRESEEGLRVEEEELKRGRKGEKEGRWCRRLGGDRDQSFNNTTVEGKAGRKLFGSSAKRGQKKAKKTCSPRG
jgi:hypothetical protein